MRFILGRPIVNRKLLLFCWACWLQNGIPSSWTNATGRLSLVSIHEGYWPLVLGFLSKFLKFALNSFAPSTGRLVGEDNRPTLRYWTLQLIALEIINLDYLHYLASRAYHLWTWCTIPIILSQSIYTAFDAQRRCTKLLKALTYSLWIISRETDRSVRSDSNQNRATQFRKKAFKVTDLRRPRNRRRRRRPTLRSTG
jgi:hypothetical protein